MNKRTWHYLLHPKYFEISCSKCGGDNIWWSEYERHIWCYDCEIDDDGNSGIFDGLIPMQLYAVMRMNFDRYNMKTDEIEIFNLEDGEWVPLSKFNKTYTKEILLNMKNIENVYKNRYGRDIFNRIKRYERFMNDA